MRKRRRSCSGGLGWRGQPLAMLGWVVRGWRGRAFRVDGGVGRRRACRRECGCHEGRRHKRMCLYMRRIASSGCGCGCGILLGLLAKIKCSICSYQFNIWYTGHWLVDINLIFGIGELSQFTGGFRALAMDLHPSMAEASNHQLRFWAFGCWYSTFNGSCRPPHFRRPPSPQNVYMLPALNQRGTSPSEERATPRSPPPTPPAWSPHRCPGRKRGGTAQGKGFRRDRRTALPRRPSSTTVD